MDRRRWGLAGLVALSLAVHAKGLFAPMLDYHFHRQVNTASIARDYYREDRPLLKPRIDWAGPEDRLAATEFPVEMWLHGKLWGVFGWGESWGRILSAAASAVTVVFLFLLFEREFGSAAAFCGAGLFTVLPVEVYFGRTVQPEAAALMGFIVSLYFWDRSLEKGRPAGAWLAAVAGAFLAIALKLPYAHMVFPLAGLSWRRLGRAALTDARTWAAGATAAAGVLAWFVYASRGVYVVPTHTNEFWRILGYERTLYFTKFLIVSRLPELMTTYGGMVFFFVGAREILFRRRDAFWLSWLGGSFAHLIALGAYGHIHEYTCLPLAAGIAGLMGFGLNKMREGVPSVAPARRGWAAAGLVFLVVSVPVHAALRVGHWYRQGFEYLARAGDAAGAVSRPGDLFFTNSVAPSVLLYYLDRRGWSEEFSLYTTEECRIMIDRRAAQGVRFLASEKKGVFGEPDGPLWRLMRARTAPVWDDGNLVIFPLAAPAAAPTASR